MPSQPLPVPTLTFRPDLQGLRAIAIALVVLSHAGFSVFPGGFIGVDVFFVLSGYLITGLLLRELDENDRIVFSRFYAKRLKRLLPALVVMIFVSYWAASILLSDAEARSQLASAPFAATWTSNLYFAFSSVGYFNELADRDLFIHSWSLGVEEQFYLVWPVLLLLFYKLGQAQFVTGFHGKNLLWLGLMVAFVVSLAVSIYWTYAWPQSAFYQMPSRIWQFSLGGIVQFTIQGKNSYVDWLRRPHRGGVVWFVGVIGLGLIVGSAVVIHPGLEYPGAWALVPSFGAAMVIIAGCGFSNIDKWPLQHPLVVWLGDRSYSLYLWHWPVLVLGFSLGFKEQVIPTIGLILLSILAAFLSYRFVELPFWKGRYSFGSSRHILLVGVLLMVTMLFGLNSSLRNLPKAGEGIDRSAQWRMDLPVIYRMQCDAWYANNKVEPCVFGNPNASKTVVLLGDSVGAQWFSAIFGAFPESDWRTVVLTKSACAMVDEDYYYERIGKIYHVCSSWRNAVMDELDKQQPDVIVMGSAASYSFSKSDWVDGSKRVLERISKAAGKVYVIPGTPSLSFDGPGCVDRNLSSDGVIDMSSCLSRDRLKLVESVTGYLRQASDAFQNVYMLELNDLVCPGGNCNAVSKDGMVVFRDSQHLTDSFVRSLVTSVRGRLEN